MFIVKSIRCLFLAVVGFNLMGCTASQFVGDTYITPENEQTAILNLSSDSLKYTVKFIPVPASTEFSFYSDFVECPASTESKGQIVLSQYSKEKSVKIPAKKWLYIEMVDVSGAFPNSLTYKRAIRFKPDVGKEYDLKFVMKRTMVDLALKEKLKVENEYVYLDVHSEIKGSFSPVCLNNISTPQNKKHKYRAE